MLTHQPRDPIPLARDTTFHFVTDGFDAAYSAARDVAGERGAGWTSPAVPQRFVRLSSLGSSTSSPSTSPPVLLGSGERLFDGIGSFDFQPVEVLHSPLATHIRYRRTA